jgi:biofilm PGA synthesis N-glycosyltransferase PgaC
VTWRLQVAGWRVVFQPNAIVWILMPETLKGLWKQRLRWAEGGAQMMIDFFPTMIRGRAPGLLPTYINTAISMIWANTIVLSLGAGLLSVLGLVPASALAGFKRIPEWWGLTLTVTYLVQALVSHLLERRYEPDMLRSLYWMIWYPLAFWLISTVTSVAALPLALLRPRQARTTWVSPDRGLR